MKDQKQQKTHTENTHKKTWIEKALDESFEISPDKLTTEDKITRLFLAEFALKEGLFI